MAFPIKQPGLSDDGPSVSGFAATSVLPRPRKRLVVICQAGDKTLHKRLVDDSARLLHQYLRLTDFIGDPVGILPACQEHLGNNDAGEALWDASAARAGNIDGLRGRIHGAVKIAFQAVGVRLVGQDARFDFESCFLPARKRKSFSEIVNRRIEPSRDNV